MPSVAGWAATVAPPRLKARPAFRAIIAAGTVRGEGIASLADGRIVVAHSTGLDVIRPMRAPLIIATSIQDGAIINDPIKIEKAHSMTLKPGGYQLLIEANGTLILNIL